MNSVWNVDYNIKIDRRRIYPGETWIDRVPTPPLSVFHYNIPISKRDKNDSK